jgi:hypothetical protein
MALKLQGTWMPDQVRHNRNSDSNYNVKTEYFIMIKKYPNLLNKELSIKYYVIILAVLMIASFFMLFIFKENRVHKIKMREEILINKISDLEKKYGISQTTIDHLNKKISEIEKTFQVVPQPPDLKINDIDDPISYLKKDLKKRKDLIPYDGVLGGTMGFYDENSIHVLNYKWVYAHFEDGHIGGEMLLEYSISDGKINWKVIDAFH